MLDSLLSPNLTARIHASLGPAVGQTLNVCAENDDVKGLHEALTTTC